MTAIALIPARGGSKRLPRKNVRSFAGRPLLAYSVAAAKASHGISGCIVSTEDEEIASIGRDCGAEVVWRPTELATDTATSASVTVHVLQTLRRHARLPEVVVLLQPTNPLRPRNLIADALTMLAEGGADSVMSVSPCPQKTGSMVNGLYQPEYRPGTRSQDLPPRFSENGLVYAAWTQMVLDTGTLLGAAIRPLVVDAPYASVDIDTWENFAAAEQMFHMYRGHFDWLAQGVADRLSRAATDARSPVETAAIPGVQP